MLLTRGTRLFEIEVVAGSVAIQPVAILEARLLQLSLRLGVDLHRADRNIAAQVPIGRTSSVVSRSFAASTNHLIGQGAQVILRTGIAVAERKAAYIGRFDVRDTEARAPNRGAIGVLLDSCPAAHEQQRAENHPDKGEYQPLHSAS